MDLTNLTDNELSASLSSRRSEAERLRGLPRNRSRAVAHDRATASRAEARRQLAERLRSRVYDLATSGGAAVLTPGIADLYVLGYVDEVTTMQHTYIDETPTGVTAGAVFPPEPAEVAAMLAKLGEDIGAMEAEQGRRADLRAAAELAEAEAELDRQARRVRERGPV